MKPIQFFLLAFVAQFVIGCTQTTKITHRTINYEYYNVTFFPEQIDKLGNGGIEITVTPIDAARLNRETFYAANQDGNYEKELSSVVKGWSRDLGELSKKERVYVKGKLNGIDAISKLEKANQIPSNASNQLKLRIWNGVEYGRNGLEVTSLSNSENFPSNFNPYRVNEKYLSVFKLNFENKGEAIEVVKLSDIQILNGEDLLYPFGNEYFEKYWRDDHEISNITFRINMPSELLLAPGQKVIKYIAVPAINTKKENLQVQILRANKMVNFDFKVREKIETKSYKVERFDITASGSGDANFYNFYYVVNFHNGTSFATKSSYLYIDENMKSKIVSIYAVAIHLQNSSIRMGRRLDFQFSEIENNKVIVQFDGPKYK